MARKCVLVVDDDEGVRQILRLVLENEGYAVAEASNGQAALQKLRAAANPCVILLDLMMPVMDGWSFRAQQALDPKFASIPVLILSAISELQAKLSSLRPAGFLRKPIDFDALVHALRQHCH